MGSPSREATDLGPQADSTQTAAVAKYLDIGNSEGRALIGGKKATEFGENFIQPTVFTDIPDTSKLNVEEVFGPVLVLHEFETEEEVIRRANDTECK
jgi:aldehyde dehydrogenase (NAD+)